ncbi:hypothetical protein GCM10011613_20750 [Cellvibrio zantedeschiae]|uniref:DUF899 domain-containing protein n=1 Tax=Cellvibrio zantedeschiae TaxID=1237077 RepID=A0ABQ3B547_9GAMM|nr:DUF899 domain-containing protein [Cellvibrio zantedeschiae]GGY75103.1 hypothetical protein GCM10011613_20750 [Cellvibrio zantedeschiae]
MSNIPKNPTPLNALPPIVTQAKWLKSHEALLAKEKAHTRAGDALAAERRRQPMVQVTKKYKFNNEDSELGLLDLFEGRRQLIVYHHMLKPADKSPCPGCCMFTDMVSHLAHLNARDTTFALVSRAPIDEIVPFKKRMGWDIPWHSNSDDFNADFMVTDGFGLNIFLQDSENIYHTYFTTGRGVEHLGNVWTFLDLTPLGRQEKWEVSPSGWPQTAPYQWWKLHDDYENKMQTNCCDSN